MGRLHWTREQKQDFWAAFVRHRDEGCSIKEAWSRAYADFRAEGKLAPGLRTFGNWYRKAMAGAGLSDESDQSDQSAGTEDEAAEESTESIPSTESTADDYTRKLEAMLRLYRRRTEADVDAVCDCLLPDLFPAEEE